MLSLVFTLSSTWAELRASGVTETFANRDFANYWIAGRLVASGEVLDLFGPQPDYFQHMTAVFGADYRWHNWSYPPHYLFFVSPLGAFDYKLSMALFLGLTAVFYIYAALRFAPDHKRWIVVAILPFLAHNLATSQNGYLFGAVALLVLALRDTRPILAGMLLGVLTIKPQLGLLFPFLLLAERRWTVIITATATTIALVAASAAVFGLDTWRGYLSEVVPYQAFVTKYLEGVFLDMLPSSYGMLRRYGVEASLALPLHLLVAVPAFCLAVYSFFIARRDEDRSILLLVATFVITPYALSYDLGMVAPALALMAARLSPQHGWRSALHATAMLLPALMIPLGALGIAIAPFVLIGVFALALTQIVAERKRSAPRHPSQREIDPPAVLEQR